MTKIEQLENELKQKTDELNESLNIQYLLRETLKSNTRTLGEIELLLRGITANLECSNECVEALRLENHGLKLVGDAWMKRAIKLEFEVLRARDEAKK
ncbi:MAG: hypothetical protein EPN17_17885 [Methylobacter sp.]|nr:MAG: hypothetical protein EPN17_17885 [Methylobacter sp.]